MDYKKVYGSLVLKAQNRETVTGYSEVHHITPRCVGGKDEEQNLVRLTAREHFIAHWLLSRMYPEESKLVAAFWFMCNQRGSNNQYQRYRPSSRQYAEAKERFKVIQQQERIGTGNPNYGNVGAKNTKSRPIYKMDLNGNVLCKYDNSVHAARVTGIKQPNIHKCCQQLKGYKTAGGYRWSFA